MVTLTASPVNLEPSHANTTTLVALPAEILVKIFKSTNLVTLASLTQSSSLLRKVVKEHSRDICNALVENQVVELNAKDLFDLHQNESTEEWLLPKTYVFRSFEVYVPHIDHRYLGTPEITRKSVEPLTLPGPKFLHFIETFAPHIRYLASERRQNVVKMRGIRRDKVEELKLRMESVEQRREYDNLTDEGVESFMKGMGKMIMSKNERWDLNSTSMAAVEGERSALQSLLVPLVRKYAARAGFKQLLWWYGL